MAHHQTRPVGVGKWSPLVQPRASLVLRCWLFHGTSFEAAATLAKRKIDIETCSTQEGDDLCRILQDDVEVEG